MCRMRQARRIPYRAGDEITCDKNEAAITLMALGEMTKQGWGFPARDRRGSEQDCVGDVLLPSVEPGGLGGK